MDGGIEQIVVTKSTRASDGASVLSLDFDKAAFDELGNADRIKVAIALLEVAHQLMRSSYPSPDPLISVVGQEIEEDPEITEERHRRQAEELNDTCIRH